MQQADAIGKFFAVFCPIWLLTVTGCGGADDAPVAEEKALPEVVALPTCITTGRLTIDAHRTVQGEYYWREDNIDCESMRRPNGEGIRLRFTGSLREELKFAVIVAMPKLRPGQTTNGVPSKLTMSIEGSGRFFSTANLDACWTDVHEQRPIDDGRYAIAGIVSCISPLGEINGTGSVTISELKFGGVADWNST